MKFVSVDPLPLRFTAGNMIKYCARGCLDEGLSKFWGSFPCCKAIKSADNIMPFTRKKNPKHYQRLLSYLEVLKDLFISVKIKKVKVCGRLKKKKKVFVLLTIISALRKGGEKNNNKE